MWPTYTGGEFADTERGRQGTGEAKQPILRLCLAGLVVLSLIRVFSRRLLAVYGTTCTCPDDLSGWRLSWFLASVARPLTLSFAGGGSAGATRGGNL